MNEMRVCCLLLLALTSAALLLTGCRDEKIIERMGFTRTVALDFPEGEEDKTKLKVTISIPKSEPVNARIVLTTIAQSNKEARIMFSRQNNRQIVSGQLRTVMFGTKLAKDGIWKHIDTLVRDPSIGSKVNVVVVNGNANALLQRTYKQFPSTGEYIEDLVRTERASTEIPISNLHTFSRDYFDDGIDPVTPLIKESKEALSLDGIALFRDDTYVMRVEPQKSLLFNFLHKNFVTGEVVMAMPVQDGEQQRVMLSFVASNRKIKIRHPKTIRGGKDITVNIHLKIRGEVLEYHGKLNLQKSSDQRELEKRMKAYVEKETKLLVEKMQKQRLDPLGIGQHARNSMRYAQWKKLDWREMIPDLKFNITADVKIKDIGKLQT
ncbi:Ger(x)C family spore germination protein [Paenibacillus methanolicus]|uniref:Spore germination protein n=1 Tax=Paenibacillus methanolicus TaxID=582686 RepID=A0A5S5BQR2_9BACL|nr:Ger(x)C family spore germination protein [Paenibacillus methanolicus]TYP68668.1 spore germination protein [Paenibacillus methanolicus]